MNIGNDLLTNENKNASPAQAGIFVHYKYITVQQAYC